MDSSGENIARDMWERNTQPSNLELRIRKEVMDLLDETVCDVGLLSIHSDTSTNKLKTIKDRLNLLWGE